MCDRWTSGDMRKMHIRRIFPAFRKAAAEGLVPTFHRHQVQQAKMEFLAHSSHKAQQVGSRPRDDSASLTRGYSTNLLFPLGASLQPNGSGEPHTPKFFGRYHPVETGVSDETGCTRAHLTPSNSNTKLLVHWRPPPACVVTQGLATGGPARCRESTIIDDSPC